MTSEFWRQLAGEHATQLDSKGLALVKRVQALRYFTWRWDPRRFFAEQGRYLIAKAPRTAWLRAAVTRANLSDEAWAPVDWPRRDRWLYTIATRVLWDFARRRGSSAVLELEEPILGSPLPVSWRGRLISQDLANTSLEVASLIEALGGRRPRQVLEIGAGYGRSAHALLSIWPQTAYTIIDIEPAITISRWYLTSLFPDRDLRFVNAGERDTTLEPFDVAISISSLQEMTLLEIGRYFELLDRCAAPNAVVYLKQWEGWLNPVDGVRHSMDSYPVPNRWRPVFRRRAPVQTMFDEAAWVVEGS